MYFRSRKAKNKYRLPLTVFALVIVLVIFFHALSQFGRSTLLRQQESLEKALSRDIAECYAMEGMYPPSLSYMKEHYGLTYDETLFFVDYRPIGGNLYPDYVVMPAE